MSPNKRCLVCPNNNRNNPKMIFVQMPHPKKEPRSRKAWFAVYKDVLDYNDQLDCHLCSDHFNLENDASNLEYYLAKRMKKLLFKPNALPKPLPVLPKESPMVYKDTYETIKQEPEEYVEQEDQYQEQQADTDSFEEQEPEYVKEEPIDIEENEIRNDPIDIKLEQEDEETEVSGPSPPPLVAAASLVSRQEAVQDGSQQQPLVINSFQIANQQLRSQLLRLAAEGRLRVVNVSNVDNMGGSTPTLAVLGGDNVAMNSISGAFNQAAPMTVRLGAPGPPQLVRKPGQIQQIPQPQPVLLPQQMQQPQQIQQLQQLQQLQQIQQLQPVRQMMVAQNQMGQQLQLVNMPGQVMNIRPISSTASIQPLPILQSPINPSTFLRHQLILPHGAVLMPPVVTTAPSLVPLPMRSVFACGKCTELFYTTEDRDKHIKTKHVDNVFAHTTVANSMGTLGAKQANAKMTAKAGREMRDGEQVFKCEICQSIMPISQKIAHLGTHETFKCVTCHQTLEKRIYATHMMSHIEGQPGDKPVTREPQKRPIRNLNIKHPVQRHATKLLPKPAVPVLVQQTVANGASNKPDVTIFEVQKKTSDTDPDVEKNLNEYMIPTDAKNKLDYDSNPKGMEMYYLYNCRYCRKMFRTKEMLETHQVDHHRRPHNLTSIKCDYCLEDVIRQKMKQHIQTMHPDKVYLCPHCQAAFSHHHSYLRHLRIAHKDVNRTVNVGRKQPTKRRLLPKPSNPPKPNTIKTLEFVRQPQDDEDMDYDEDYPLATLIRQQDDGNVEYSTSQAQQTDVDVTEMGEEEDQVDDSPDYIDIEQYKVMT